MSDRNRRRRQPRDRGPRRSRPLTERIAEPRALWAAWAKVSSGTGMPGVDAVTPRAFASDADAHINRLREDLATGSYRPAPLKAFTREIGGKVRRFAMPTVRDRIAQRAALDCVGHSLSRQQLDVSFAYRSGRSWLDALRMVERHRSSGHRWIFRCDIRDFFDSVNHDAMRVVLECLLPFESDTELLMDWIRVPRVSDAGMTQDGIGLPLGLAISGALANAYLTPFDLAVTTPSRQVVRYADDTVVLCRTLEEAQRAAHDVVVALRDLALSPHPTKSYVTSFDNGFSFLGWTFCSNGGFQTDPNSEWTHPLSYLR